MLPRPREPRLAACALALLAAVACTPSSGVPGAAPTPTATVPSRPQVTPPSPSPQAPAVPVGRTYVLGVIGDYGVDDQPVRDVVKTMGAFNDGKPLDAVVTTGDNAYCCGSGSQSAFAYRMLAPLRRAGAPVYAALGNHDVVTDEGRPFMHVYGMTKRWYTAEVGPVQLVVLDSTRAADKEQLAFLKAVLAKKRPKAFRVVAFHHPAWSCSAHSPEAPVLNRWVPLFGRKVDLVLAGHNHTYERFTSPEGVPYVTTGGGGARLYPSSLPFCRGYGKAEFVNTVHHAVRLTVNRSLLVLEAIGLDGAPFDSVTIAPRRT